MKGELKQVEKYGAVVWQNVMMDELRKDECLCLNCGSIKECGVGSSLYATCKTCDLALAVTRCPRFVMSNNKGL